MEFSEQLSIINEQSQTRVDVLTSRSAADTRAIGESLAQKINRGTVIALTGELGSGKTCLVQGICTGLDVHQHVTSPTFTIINEYQGRIPVFHIDLYRLEILQELEQIGFEEYLFGSGVCLIEWADKVTPLLPEHRIDICLDFVSKRSLWRKLTITYL